MTRRLEAGRTRPVKRVPKNAKVLQPGSRVCRYPGRDLLTGARLEAGADVRVVSEFGWYGPRQKRVQPTEYGPSHGAVVGVGRDLKDWPARRAALAAAEARADEESA